VGPAVRWTPSTFDTDHIPSPQGNTRDEDPRECVSFSFSSCMLTFSR
jgi:hypothetical protein